MRLILVTVAAAAAIMWYVNAFYNTAEGKERVQVNSAYPAIRTAEATGAAGAAGAAGQANAAGSAAADANKAAGGNKDAGLPAAAATPAPKASAAKRTRNANMTSVGYWHNFDNGSKALRLKDVPAYYDVVDVAFAEPSSRADGTMAFVPFKTSAALFKADVKALQKTGKKVLISIGGANGYIDLSKKSDMDNFTRSMTSIIETYGFDGVDIDLEGASIFLDAGDTDFRQPTTPRIVNLIQSMKTLRSHFGNRFMITMAPETTYVQGGYVAYGGPWGAYLPVIDQLRDQLSFIHVQHYNSGGMEALDGQLYQQGTADFQVAMADMLLHGFPVARNADNAFPPLDAGQIVIGLPSAPGAASGGYTPADEVKKALQYLATGETFGGAYLLQTPSGYPDLKGLMMWSINWDAASNYAFAKSIFPYLKGKG